MSLGLAVGRAPVVGVIFNPWQDVLFTAVRGRGAFMTRGRDAAPRRLPLAPTPRPLDGLGSALVGVEWGSDRDGPNFDLKVDVFQRLARGRETGGAMVHSLRSMGSTALNLAAVAAGQLDAYWEGGCWAWDVCAGWCILEEAGGRMVSGNPGDWHPALDGRVYLAVRGAPEDRRSWCASCGTSSETARWIIQCRAAAVVCAGTMPGRPRWPAHEVGCTETGRGLGARPPPPPADGRCSGPGKEKRGGRALGDGAITEAHAMVVGFTSIVDLFTTDGLSRRHDAAAGKRQRLPSDADHRARHACTPRHGVGGASRDVCSAASVPGQAGSRRRGAGVRR